MFDLQVIDDLIQKGIDNKIHKCLSVPPKGILIFKHVINKNKDSQVPLKPGIEMIETAFKNKSWVSRTFHLWLRKLLLRVVQWLAHSHLAGMSETFSVAGNYSYLWLPLSWSNSSYLKRLLLFHLLSFCTRVSYLLRYFVFPKEVETVWPLLSPWEISALTNQGILLHSRTNAFLLLFKSSTNGPFGLNLEDPESALVASG